MVELREVTSTRRQSLESSQVGPGFRGRSTSGWLRTPRPASGTRSPKTPSMRPARGFGEGLTLRQPGTRSNGGRAPDIGMSASQPTQATEEFVDPTTTQVSAFRDHPRHFGGRALPLRDTGSGRTMNVSQLAAQTLKLAATGTMWPFTQTR